MGGLSCYSNIKRVGERHGKSMRHPQQNTQPQIRIFSTQLKTVKEKFQHPFNFQSKNAHFPSPVIKFIGSGYRKTFFLPWLTVIKIRTKEKIIMDFIAPDSSRFSKTFFR